MLVKMIFKYVPLCLGLLVPLYANAVEHRTVTLGVNGPSVSGPADRASYASTVATYGNSGYTNVCSSETLDYTVGRIDITTILPYTGRTHQPTSSHQVYYMFDMGVDGLAFDANVNGGWLQTPMANGRSIIPGTNTVFTGAVDNTSRKTRFPTSAFSFILKDAGRVLVGQTPVPGNDVYRFECYDNSGALQETITVRYNAFTIYSSVTTCTPNTTEYLIRMRDLNLEDVEKASVNTIFESVERTFNLTCPTGIDLYLTVNDLVDSGNLTQISKLTSDSTGKGVGFQASTLSGRVFTLSPPGSTPGIPGRDQVWVKKTTTNNEAVSFSLKFNYLKTDNEVSEGKVRSILGITYSYQ